MLCPVALLLKTKTMKKIKLTQGKHALVDDEDFEWLNQWKWSFLSSGYAVRSRWSLEEKRYKMILMHREINKTPKGLTTDHINQNKLDNRKVNLRTVTKSQNAHNSKLFSTNTSGCKGVRYDKRFKNWEARIVSNYQEIYLGSFKNKQQAIKARKEAEQLYAI